MSVLKKHSLIALFYIAGLTRKKKDEYDRRGVVRTSETSKIESFATIVHGF